MIKKNLTAAAIGLSLISGGFGISNASEFPSQDNKKTNLVNVINSSIGSKSARIYNEPDLQKFVQTSKAPLDSTRLDIYPREGAPLVKASGLLVGEEYVYTSKPQFVDDFRAQWEPSLVFVADSPTTFIESSTMGTSEFNLLFKWSEYATNQTLAKIINPLEGNRVTNDLVVRGKLDDLFSQEVARLYIDGEIVDSITNGPLEFVIQKEILQRFGNGPHRLDMVVDSVDVGDQQVYSSYANVKDVNFDFPLTASGNPPFLSGDFGSTMLKMQTTQPCDYSIDITYEDGTPVRTLSGTKEAGEIEIPWDFSDSFGNTVPDGTNYVLNFSSVPHSSGLERLTQRANMPSSPTNSLPIKMWKEHWSYGGKSFLFRVQIGGLYDRTERNLMEDTRWIIDTASLMTIEPDRGVLDYDVFVWKDDWQKYPILQNMKREDVGHIIAMAHGRRDEIGGGAKDTTVTTSLLNADIALTLGNLAGEQKRKYEFNNPKRAVVLNSCSSGAGTLCNAFGIPRSVDLDKHPTIPRRSFLGWSGPTYTTFYDDKYVDFMRAFQLIWTSTENMPIQAAITEAILDGGPIGMINPNELTLYGSRFTTWNHWR